MRAPKYPLKVIALTLIAGLLADPATASAFSPDLSPISCPIKIPARYGVITDSFGFRVSGSEFKRDSSNSKLETRNSKIVVLIQDLHGHVEGQRNIAEIIKWLAKGGARRVGPSSALGSFLPIFVEGAKGPFDLTPLRHLADRQVKARLLQDLLEERKLTGAEIAVVETDQPIHLWGIDDRKLYRQNLLAFARANQSSPHPHPKHPAWQKYYQIAEQRNIPLALNMLAHWDLLSRQRATGMGQPGCTVAGCLFPAVLVVGGYHTAGITHLLKANGVPYLVVTPKLGQLGDERAYTQRLRTVAEHLQTEALAAPLLGAVIAIVGLDLPNLQTEVVQWLSAPASSDLISPMTIFEPLKLNAAAWVLWGSGGLAAWLWNHFKGPYAVKIDSMDTGNLHRLDGHLGPDVKVFALRAHPNQLEPFISVREDANGRIEFKRGERAIYVDGKPVSWPDGRARVVRSHPDHLAVLKDSLGDRSVLAIPYGDLYMNDGFVVYVHGKVYCRAGEPLAEREYDALVKRNNGQVTIQKVKYRKTERVGESDIVLDAEGNDVTGSVALTFNGPQLLRKGEAVPLDEIYDQFDDLGHLFFFPKLDGKVEFGLKRLYEDRTLVRDLIRGKSVRLPLDGVQKEALRDALAKGGYHEAGPAKELEEGEFRFDDHEIEIRYKRARYSHNLVGLTTEGEVLVVAIAGRGKENIGVTIEEAAQELRRRGARDALLISSGSDVKPMWDGVAQVSAAEAAKSDSSSGLVVFAYSPHRSCDICGAQQPILRFRKGAVDVVQCRDCGHFYRGRLPTRRELEAIYSRAYFDKHPGEEGHEGYQNYTGQELARRLDKARHVIEQINSAYDRFGGRQPRQHFLDVGAAAGYLLLAARHSGWETAEGIDLSEYAVQKAAELEKKAFFKMKVKLGTLETAGYPQGYFDVVNMSDVLEHVPNPRSTLQEANRVMREGGILSIVTPDFDCLVSTLQGANFWEIHPDHLSYFTAATLTQLLNKTGFEVVGLDADQLTEDQVQELTPQILEGKPVPQGTKITVFARKRSTVKGRASPPPGVDAQQQILQEYAKRLRKQRQGANATASPTIIRATRDSHRGGFLQRYWQAIQRYFRREGSWIKAHATDHGPDFHLRLDRETLTLFRLAESCGLSIAITGSMARRMAWGQKPFSEHTDLDILVEFPVDPQERLETLVRLGQFQKKVAKRFPGLYVDVVNEPLRVAAPIRRPTVNTLYVSRKDEYWEISDIAGGAYLEDARSRTVRFEPDDKIPLRLSDVLKLVKLEEDAADIALTFDERSQNEALKLLRSGLIVAGDATSGLQAAIERFNQTVVDPGNQVIGALGKLLNALMRSDNPDKVFEKCRRFRGSEVDLVEIFDQVIDLKMVVSRVKELHRLGKIPHLSDFDPYFLSSIANDPLARAFNSTTFESFLREAIVSAIQRPLDASEQSWLSMFVRIELLPWVRNWEKDLAPFRKLSAQRALSFATDALISSTPTDRSLRSLAFVVTREFSGHLQNEMEAIQGAIRAGQYKHLLHYYAEHSAHHEGPVGKSSLSKSKRWIAQKVLQKFLRTLRSRA